MTKKVFLNFWQASLIIICLIISYLIIYYFTDRLITNNPNNLSFYKSIQIVAIVLNYIPYILFLCEKSDINIINYFALPDLDTLFKIIIISLIIRFVIWVPFDSPIVFFKSLINSKLRYNSISIPSDIGFVVGFRWIFIPLMEEILFRGIFLKQFLKQYSPTKAILLSSLIFSIYHLQPLNAIGLFICGIVLSTIYYKTNSILVSTLAHLILSLGHILKFEYLDINHFDLFIYIIVFAISILIVRYILNKQMRTIKINNMINNE